MKFLQGLGLALAILIGTAMAVAITGGVIYLTIPPAAEWMDENIFNVKDDTTNEETPPEDENGEENEEDVTDPETELTARINFNTKSIILEV